MNRPGEKRRNPVLWLVIALPALSVVAGIGLVVVAVRSGGSDAVPVEVRRTAQVQVADLAPDEAARRAGLRAVLRIDADAGRIQLLPVAGQFDRGEPLQLALGHPTQEARDRVLALLPEELGWGAEARLEPGQDWTLRLAPPAGDWRLQGRLRAGEQAAVLLPAVAREGPSK
jgi:uncharacterized protein